MSHYSTAMRGLLLSYQLVYSLGPHIWVPVGYPAPDLVRHSDTPEAPGSRTPRHPRTYHIPDIERGKDQADM